MKWLTGPGNIAARARHPHCYYVSGDVRAYWWKAVDWVFYWIHNAIVRGDWKKARTHARCFLLQIPKRFGKVRP